MVAVEIFVDVLQKQLMMIEKSYSSVTSREILAAKHSSACQISQAISSQEKDMLNLKASCMEFTKLGVPNLSSTEEKQEFLAMDQMLSKMAAIHSQFRHDKAMRFDQNPEGYVNELKWHGLQKKQLKSYWNWCKDKLNSAEDDRLKAFMQDAIVYFRAAANLSKTLSKMELGVRNMEEIIRAFDASLEKLPAEVHPERDQSAQQQSVGRNGEPGTLTTADTEQRATSVAGNSLQSLHVATQFLSMVKDIQDMRGVAQENRQVLERFPAIP